MPSPRLREDPNSAGNKIPLLLLWLLRLDELGSCILPADMVWVLLVVVV